MRAETLADHLERVQWAVRPTSVISRPSCAEAPLPVDLNAIEESEVVSAARALKSCRTPGLDNVPAEFWKSVLLPGSAASAYITEFCNVCWQRKAVPDDWHRARVAMIFKKDDPASCDNYRPISLLSIGYKMFAVILLERLRRAGAEKRLWPTQFGFRSKSGTADALFVARRELERANCEKNGKSVFLALDWAKAFDSVSPEALANALLRFGVPQHFVEMIQAIYTERQFIVQDAGVLSD